MLDTYPFQFITPCVLRLRLILLLLIGCTFGKVLTFCGIVCSTWIALNVGTSRRSILAVGGDETSVATRRGNIMCARTGVETNVLYCFFFEFDWLLL